MPQYVVMEAGWEYNDETYDNDNDKEQQRGKIFHDKESAEKYALNLTIDRVKYMDINELELYNDWKPVMSMNQYLDVMGFDKDMIGPLKMMDALGDKEDEMELPKDEEKRIKFIKNMKVEFFKVVEVD